MPQDGTEHRKLAAIMFTDMVGYSALMQRNEALALELIEEHHRLLRPIFPKFGGREIKSTGDGFLVEFASALAAAQCAIEIQRTLVQYNSSASPERRYQVRIGVHLGDVVLREADIFGDGVNIAARIEPLAEAGGICLSRPVFDQVANKLDAALVKLGSPELKNIQVPMEVYRVVLPWQQADSSKRSATEFFARTTGRKTWRTPAVVLGTALVLALISAIVFVATRNGRIPLPSGTDKQAAPASQRATAAARIEWLAVLPLRNFSADTNQEYFVDGMTDILTTELSHISGLKVKSFTTAMTYKGTKKSAPEIGRDLNVDAVLEGSVQREGEQVLISVQLIEVATDQHLWARNYARDMKHVLKMKSELAEAIAAEIQVKLTPQERAHLASARQRKPEAVENYLKGRHLLNRQTETDLNASTNYFNRALQIEPDYAEAYAGLAGAYSSLSSVFVAPQKVMPLARTNALKALQLDDTLAEAHHRLGFIQLMFDYAFAEAEKEFQIALKLNPNLAEAHDGYAFYLQVMERFPEAIAQDEIAYKLSPLSMVIGMNFVGTLFTARQYDRAIRQGAQILELQKDNHMAAGWMGLAYAHLGDPRSAIAKLEPICGLKDRSPMLLGFLAYAFALANQKDDARRTLVELERIAREQYVCAFEIATVYVGLGEYDTAFNWLYEALKARADCIPFTKVDPRLDPLHPDPRFKQLLKDIGFEK